MRFLILDDDAEYRKLLGYYLSVNWPETPVDEIAPSQKRLDPAQIQVERYDSILMSHPIRGELGFEWLRALRSRDSCPPVILFAENSNEFLAVDAIKAGAASFFPKSKLRHRRLIETIRVEIGAGPAASTGTHFVNLIGLRFQQRYRFLDTLHHGQASSVYLAKVLSDDSRVAFKVLRHVPDSGSDDLFVRFLREYELVAEIDHPNIVKIFDLGVADDHAYIAMEYLPAGNLSLKLNKALAPAIALDYTCQIASSLISIHSAGILHRDLKPSNIMFRDDGSLALIDFGLAKQMQLEAAITDAGHIFGTPYYMSPEQGHGLQLDQRSDIYSLGCIFYEMLTGRRPFRAASAMGVIYQHAHAERPQLTPRLDRYQSLLSRMIAADPEQRYPSAEALLEDVTKVKPAKGA